MNLYTLSHQNLDIFIRKTILYNRFGNVKLRKSFSIFKKNRKINSIFNIAKLDRESEIGSKVNFVEKEKQKFQK